MTTGSLLLRAPGLNGASLGKLVLVLKGQWAPCPAESSPRGVRAVRGTGLFQCYTDHLAGSSSDVCGRVKRSEPSRQLRRQRWSCYPGFIWVEHKTDEVYGMQVGSESSVSQEDSHLIVVKLQRFQLSSVRFRSASVSDPSNSAAT